MHDDWSVRLELGERTRPDQSSQTIGVYANLYRNACIYLDSLSYKGEENPFCSALDAESEKIVQDALERVSEGKVVVAILYRDESKLT